MNLFSDTTMFKTVFYIILLITVFQITQDYTSERKKMIRDQIVARGINDLATIKAMEAVPRHEFVPPDMAPYAYSDGPLSIGYEQTISQPYIVAYMTSSLELKKNDTVLEIGTGSGYQAAVLAEIVSQVYTIEIVEPLGKEAIQRFKELGYKNIETRIGDGYHGWKEHAPYNAIIVTANAEEIPPELINQLAEGGKLIIPVGPQNYTQQLVLAEKKKGIIKKNYLLPVRFVPFTREK